MQALIGDAASGFGHEFLGHGAEFGRVGGFLVKFPGRLTQKSARGLKFDFHIGKAELQRLKLVDRGAKRLSFAHIGQCRVQCGLRGTQRTGRNVQSPAIEAGHRICETFPFVTDQIAR